MAVRSIAGGVRRRESHGEMAKSGTSKRTVMTTATPHSVLDAFRSPTQNRKARLPTSAVPALSTTTAARKTAE